MAAGERAGGSRPTLAAYGLVAAVTVIGNLLTIANPGYQSHDEWQILDFVQKYGLAFFVRAYVRVYPGPEFGWPVRPLGFLQEGLLARWMPSAPVALHLFSVALLGAAALLFTRVLSAAGLGRRRATAAGSLFAISPLATFAAGWTAACFDQWYALFAVGALWAVVAIVDRGASASRLAALGAASGLAILSKETAMVLPAAAAATAAVLPALRGEAVGWRRAVLVGAASAAPVLCYLAIRFPAILATLAGSGGPYSPSTRFLPGNALVYWAYPALASTAELPGFAAGPVAPLLAAGALHLLLLGAVLVRLGRLAAGAYLFGYFIFLLPVVTLPGPGSHYLYGSGLATALALACLLFDGAGRVHPGFPSLTAAACAAVFSLHSVAVQRVLYGNGRCQHDFLLSVDSAKEHARGRMVVRAEPGVPWWNGLRAVFGRDGYALVTVTDPASTVPADYTMDWSCRLRPVARP